MNGWQVIAWAAIGSGALVLLALCWHGTVTAVQRHGRRKRIGR